MEQVTIQVWECQESGELIEGDARVCAQVMARDAVENPLTWRLVNEWTQDALTVNDLIKERKYATGREFFIVQCDQCHLALNSGHHYSLRDLPHAVRLAVEHLDASHTVETA